MSTQTPTLSSITFKNHFVGYISILQLQQEYTANDTNAGGLGHVHDKAKEEPEVWQMVLNRHRLMQVRRAEQSEVSQSEASGVGWRGVALQLRKTGELSARRSWHKTAGEKGGVKP